MNKWLPILAVIGLLCLGVGIYSLLRPTPPPAPVVSTQPAHVPEQTITIPANSSQQFSVCAGREICIVRVEGRINYGGRWADANTTNDPAAYNSLAPGIPFGTLVGKVGSNGAWFQVGSSRTIQNYGETVFFAVNDSDYTDNKGEYSVKIEPIQPSVKTFQIPANVMWFDTGIDTTGKTITIRYVAGTWTNGGDIPVWADAKGSGSWSNVIVPGAPFRSLVGKTNEGGFYVGDYHEIKNAHGHLFLSINDVADKFSDNQGSITVSITE